MFWYIDVASEGYWPCYCNTIGHDITVTSCVEAGWWKTISCQTLFACFLRLKKRMAITVPRCPFLVARRGKVVFLRETSKPNSTAERFDSLAGFKRLKYTILRTIYCWWWYLLLWRKDVFTSLLTKERCLHAGRRYPLCTSAVNPFNTAASNLFWIRPSIQAQVYTVVKKAWPSCIGRDTVAKPC